MHDPFEKGKRNYSEEEAARSGLTAKLHEVEQKFRRHFAHPDYDLVSNPFSVCVKYKSPTGSYADFWVSIPNGKTDFRVHGTHQASEQCITEDQVLEFAGRFYAVTFGKMQP